MVWPCDEERKGTDTEKSAGNTAQTKTREAKATVEGCVEKRLGRERMNRAEWRNKLSAASATPDDGTLVEAKRKDISNNHCLRV